MSIRRERTQTNDDEQGFVPLPGGGKAKIRLPDGLDLKPLGETTESKPKPPQPDDPRPANFRNVGPFGGAG